MANVKESKDLTEVNVKNGSRRGGFMIDPLWLAVGDVLDKVDAMYARSPNDSDNNTVFDKWRDVQQMQLSIVTTDGIYDVNPADYRGFPQFEAAVLEAATQIGEGTDSIVILHHINVSEPVDLAQMAIIGEDISFFR
jgi:hypothetical protein